MTDKRKAQNREAQATFRAKQNKRKRIWALIRKLFDKLDRL